MYIGKLLLLVREIYAKKHWKALSHIALITLCISLFLVVCRNSNQTVTSTPTPHVFRGEYCHAGEEWNSLEDAFTVSALDGDLWFRGHFEQEIPENHVVYFYINHIAYTITVNGEPLSELSFETHKISSGLCAEKWIHFVSPGITPDDTVEIHLSNPHRFGNAKAYSAFLGSFYSGPSFEIEHTLQNILAPKCAVYRGIGTLIFILSIGIMGVALTFSLLRISLSNRIWSLALLSFCAGGYIALDTIDLSLWSRLYAFNNYALLVCIMLGKFELGVFISTILSKKTKKISQIIVVLEGVFLACLTLLCVTDCILLYDALPYWCAVQFISSTILLACCIYEWHKTMENPPILLLSAILLLLTSSADILNSYFLWWNTGILTKWVFILAQSQILWDLGFLS